MRILICEDELIVAEYLKETCVENGYEVLAIAKNKEEAMSFIVAKKPDVVLLDINMDERMSGVKIAEGIRKMNLDIQFVFLTAFSDIETVEAAIKTQPHAYLVKPIDKSTLAANLLLINYKLDSINLKKDVVTLNLHTESGDKIINVSKLLYIESDENYCEFVYTDGHKNVERITISKASEIFDKYLIRIHKSYCVNPNYIIRFTSLKLVLENGVQLPIGRKFKENIDSFFSLKK
jgi:DNA-binding LytR/AlgR family response regulator